MIDLNDFDKNTIELHKQLKKDENEMRQKIIIKTINDIIDKHNILTNYVKKLTEEVYKSFKKLDKENMDI
jgi:hypothetical protein